MKDCTGKETISPSEGRPPKILTGRYRMLRD